MAYTNPSTKVILQAYGKFRATIGATAVNAGDLLGRDTTGHTWVPATNATPTYAEAVALENIAANGTGWMALSVVFSSKPTLGANGVPSDVAIALAADLESPLYLGTAGAPTSSAPANVQQIGVMLSTTTAFLVPATYTSGNVSVSGTLTVTGASTFGSTVTVTSASAAAVAVGANGATNPVFAVDASTGAVATGIIVKGAATGGTTSITVTDSGANASLDIEAKGTGTVTIAGTSSGITVVNRGVLKSIIIGVTRTSFAATQNITPTAAQLLGGIIDHGSATGAGTCTFPTGTLISGAIAGVAVGDSFTVIYGNSGNQTVTLTTAAGLTLVGTAAVTTGKVATITFVNTAANTWTVYMTVSG